MKPREKYFQDDGCADDDRKSAACETADDSMGSDTPEDLEGEIRWERMAMEGDSGPAQPSFDE